MLIKLLQHPMHVLLSILLKPLFTKIFKVMYKAKSRDWNIISLMASQIFILLHYRKKLAIHGQMVKFGKNI